MLHNCMDIICCNKSSSRSTLDFCLCSHTVSNLGFEGTTTCFFTHVLSAGGYPVLGWSIPLFWDGVLLLSWDGVPPARSGRGEGVPQDRVLPPLGQQREHLRCGGQYASCVHEARTFFLITSVTLQRALGYNWEMSLH